MSFLDENDPVVRFHQHCMNQLNFLYGSIHFDNTRNVENYPAEFVELDQRVHQLVRFLIVTLNESNGIQDISNVQQVHQHEAENVA